MQLSGYLLSAIASCLYSIRGQNSHNLQAFGNSISLALVLAIQSIKAYCETRTRTCITPGLAYFHLETEVIRVERSELLTLDNPECEEILANYSQLDEIIMQHGDKKEWLPVHLILGVGDYFKIKTTSKPRVGSPGELVAEATKIGWTIMSPEKT